MKQQCDRCEKKFRQLYCMPIGVWWKRSVCRQCAFVLRSRRDAQIEHEMEKRLFVTDETWSLYGVDGVLFDRPFDKKVWDECAVLVDAAEGSIAAGASG